MRTLFGVDLYRITLLDDSMEEEQWVCTPCFLGWKHKTHYLFSRPADLTVVDLKAEMLASMEDEESRDLYLEWVAEQEEG